jgi:glycogen operon protein
LLVNAHHESIPFTLPSRGEDEKWERLIDTADSGAERATYQGKEQYDIKGRSVVVLRSQRPTGDASSLVASSEAPVR